ncbi:allograft inflammatory factor 1-like [Malaclemys terrapin pileata]|uniref:allograft inflammatory factor 1-like n=1 Tax=Malaclemys terrapin pileata TaxID=2991368 RepID=UPI0023A82E15|nr:allograft inflammatory factor 1-like [Malaclemys terrapin pileata]
MCIVAKDREMQEKQEKEFCLINKEYLADEPFRDITNLQAKLDQLKDVFMGYDATRTGEIDYPTMSRILQEFGVFQSPLELKALVQEITGNTGSTVPYKDFTMVMLGRRSTMCQRIMHYNGKGGGAMKRPSLMNSGPCVTYLESTLSRVPSPLTTLPPPPPPSPADGCSET